MKLHSSVRSLCFAALAACAVLPLFAVSTSFWRSSSFQDFSEGTLTDVSLNREGSLSLAPALKEVLHSDQALVWTAAADAAGNVYLATGHRGRIYRLTPAMLKANQPVGEQKALFFSASEPEVFALAAGPDGAVYAGTSPDGRVYRITSDGQSSVYFDPKAKYIWSLVFEGPTLYVGTGDRGEIYKVTAAGKGEKFFDTQQRQVMTLASDHQGQLLAGTEPDGLIFRISNAGKGFVLYNSPLQEIHSIAVDSNGSIYATAQSAAGRNAMSMGIAGALRAATEPEPAAASVSIEADVSAKEHGDAVKTKSPKLGAVPTVDRGAFERVGSPTLGPNGIKSALYRIGTDNSVDTLWTSKTEDVDDVLPSDNGLLFSTDSKGRVYELTGNRQTTLLVETKQEETTRLMRVGDYILATTSNLGNVYRLDDRPATKGTYESVVKDTKGISKWGDLTWRGTFPQNSHIEIQTRSGNSEHPNSTWSDWSSAHTRPGQAIESPAARYIQWRAKLYSGDRGASPILDEVVVPYLPSNQAPQIEWVRAEASVSDNETDSSGPGSLTAYINAEKASQPSSAGSVNLRAGKGIRLRWQASDPDGDELTYSVYFQGEGETAWKLLKKDLTKSQYVVDGDQLPDGTYKFKIVASDEESNPPGIAKIAEMVSAPATLDNTPPNIRLEKTEVPANGVAVAHFYAEGGASVLVRAEYSVDAGDWHELYSDKGIIDSRQERFTIRASGLTPGEHLLLLRVFDSSNNQNSAKAVVVTH